jgi:hypothetical protein
MKARERAVTVMTIVNAVNVVIPADDWAFAPSKQIL